MFMPKIIIKKFFLANWLLGEDMVGSILLSEKLLDFII
jgi:hypothetical protein